MSLPVVSTPTAIQWGNNAAVTPLDPTGYAVDDWIFAVWFARESSTPTTSPPTGWTTVFSAASASSSLHIYKIKATATSQTMPTFAKASVTNMTVGAFSFNVQGGRLAAGNIVNVVSAALSTGTGANAGPTAAVTTDQADCTAIAIHGRNGDLTAAAPSAGWTEILEGSSALGNDGSLHVAKKDLAAAGSSGTFTSTVTGGAAGDTWAGCIIAICGLAPTTTVVGQSLQLKWHDRAAVGQSLQIKSHVRAIIGKSLQLVWHDRAAVARTLQTVHHVRAAVGQSLQTKWHTRAAVARTLSTPWHVRTSTNRTLQLKWHDRAVAGQSLQLKWNVRAAVARTLQTKWHVRGVAGQSLQTKWHVRSVVGRSVQIVWNVLSLSGLTAVGRTLGAVWHVRAVTNRDLQLVWHDRALVVSGSNLIASPRTVNAPLLGSDWGTYQVAGTGANGVVTRSVDLAESMGPRIIRADCDGAADYQGLQTFIGGPTAGFAVVTPSQPYVVSVWAKLTAGKNLRVTLHEFTAGAAYVTETEVQQISTGDWQKVTLTKTVTGTTARVGITVNRRTTSADRTPITIWAAGAMVESGSVASNWYPELTGRWRVRSIAGRTVQLVWNVRAAAGASLQVKWNVRAAAGRSLIVKWHDRAVVTRSLSVPWHVRSVASRSLQTPWHVRSIAGANLITRWHVRAAAGRTLITRWNVRAAVGQNLQLRWRTRALAARQLVTRWNVRATVSASLTAQWRVRVVAGRQLVVRWHDRSVIGRSLTVLWDLLSNIVTVPWASFETTTGSSSLDDSTGSSSSLDDSTGGRAGELADVAAGSTNRLEG